MKFAIHTMADQQQFNTVNPAIQVIPANMLKPIPANLPFAKPPTTIGFVPRIVNGEKRGGELVLIPAPPAINPVNK